ncbi:hypothetical protein LG3211_1050 [Lysobacter gummosus]|nr:hypothetical protein LG3211_1050 [Lysobacter gummosus]
MARQRRCCPGRSRIFTMGVSRSDTGALAVRHRFGGRGGSEPMRGDERCFAFAAARVGSIRVARCHCNEDGSGRSVMPSLVRCHRAHLRLNTSQPRTRPMP